MKTCNFLIIFYTVILWYIVEPGHLPHEQGANQWQPCVLGIYNFASIFLFSVETQQTVMTNNFLIYKALYLLVPS